MGQAPTNLFNLHSNPNEVAILSPHFTDEISGTRLLLRLHGNTRQNEDVGLGVFDFRARTLKHTTVGGGTRPPHDTGI